VTDLESAKRSELSKFVRFFNYCLEAGIYFAPSQFETGFVSTAHQPEQIEKTARIVGEAVAALRR
jgi:glutamate-1-semialdehyde 2,1-aminomutase